MSYDYSSLTHKGIQTLSPYIPGKSIEALAKEQGLTDIIKMASNENPRGCSPLVHNALAALTKQQISTYPSPMSHPLPATLAHFLHISEDRLTLSHGSDALFQLLIIGFALNQKKHIVTHDYAFQTYTILANVLGIPLVSTPLRPDWQIDLDAMIKACNDQTALIFIANPNNPTGTLLKHAELLYLLNHIPETTILVLDEAYHEYTHDNDRPDTQNLLSQFSNLVVTRTFSKAYGIAGLRLGYAMSDPSIRSVLHKIVLPFTINQAALAGGLAALQDQAFVIESAALNRQELVGVRDTLIQHNYVCLPSFANFITFDCKVDDGSIIYQKLLNKGIIVRPLHPYGLNRYLRVTIGTPEQNTRFLDTLLQIT